MQEWSLDIPYFYGILVFYRIKYNLCVPQGAAGVHGGQSCRVTVYTKHCYSQIHIRVCEHNMKTKFSFYRRAIQYQFLLKTNNLHNTLETLKSHF